MDFITKDDNTKMSTDVWHAYQNDIILNITPVRGTSFEWNKIKKAVKDRDGDTANGTQIHRHYVPYQAIRDSLEKKLQGHKREDACVELLRIMVELYRNSTFFPIDHLDPTPSNASVNDSLKASESLQTRAAMKTWINWSLEAICDFPDNIFYGPGSGDGAGKTVDVPAGATRVAQLARVKNGARLLRKEIGGNINDLVKEDGTKISSG